MKSFQDLFSENLATFGWQVAPADIPSYADCRTALYAVRDWWNGLDEVTRNVLRQYDLSDGLYSAGVHSTWATMHATLTGQFYGSLKDNLENIASCMERAFHAEKEQASDPISNVHEVVGDAPYQPDEL